MNLLKVKNWEIFFLPHSKKECTASFSGRTEANICIWYCAKMVIVIFVISHSLSPFFYFFFFLLRTLNRVELPSNQNEISPSPAPPYTDSEVVYSIYTSDWINFTSFPLTFFFSFYSWVLLVCVYICSLLALLLAEPKLWKWLITDIMHTFTKDLLNSNSDLE